MSRTFEAFVGPLFSGAFGQERFSLRALTKRQSLGTLFRYPKLGGIFSAVRLPIDVLLYLFFFPPRVK